MTGNHKEEEEAKMECPHCGEFIDESHEEFIDTVGEMPCCGGEVE